MLVFAFVTQAITGIFLWMAYSPSSTTAYESVYYIQHEMTGGWILRGIHHFMAQAMVVTMGLHLFQVVWDGAYRPPREFNYWIGLILMIFPREGVLAMVLWIGAYAVVFGVLLVALGLTLRKWVRSVEHEAHGFGTEAGEIPITFSADGTMLYVHRPDAVLPPAVTRITLATGVREPWKLLSSVESAGVYSVGPVRITPDGTAYAYNALRTLSDLYVGEGLR